jgi:hypothetical protein
MKNRANITTAVVGVLKHGHGGFALFLIKLAQ